MGGMRCRLFVLLWLFAAGCGWPSQEEMIRHARNVGVPVIINRLRITDPNYVGGVDVDVNFFNASDKTIKYLTFEVIPYNGVGDIVRSQIGGKTTASLRVVGPIVPNYQDYLTWSNVWYNSTTRCIRPTGINIEFMDGTTESAGLEEIKKYLNFKEGRQCCGFSFSDCSASGW